MQRKNSEALTTWGSQGFGVSNLSRETNMKSIAKSDLNFHGTALMPVQNITGVWLTSSDLAKALQYANSRAVTMIYNKYAEEFTSGMTQVLEVSTTASDAEVLDLSTSRNARNLKKKVRVFSLRGAHLIAMFARTPVAKEFRRWVLDILDREVAQGNVSSAFDFEMYAHNAKVACGYAESIYEQWAYELNPALKLINSPLSASINEKLKDLTAITYGLKSGLNKAAKEKGTIH